jgi:hypothetical protein
MNEVGAVSVGVPEWLVLSVIVIVLVLVGLGVWKLGKLLWAMFG